MRDWGRDSCGVVYADSSAALAVAKRKGAGKLRHINVSSLWIQERQDREDLELRKVLGTENPADLMTKYLTRESTDRCMGYMSQERQAGRAKAGLHVQGGGERKEEKENSAIDDLHTRSLSHAGAPHARAKHVRACCSQCALMTVCGNRSLPGNTPEI